MKIKFIKMFFLLGLLAPMPMFLNAEAEQSVETEEVSSADLVFESVGTRSHCSKLKRIDDLCVKKLSVLCSLFVRGRFIVNGYDFSTPASIAAAIASVALPTVTSDGPITTPGPLTIGDCVLACDGGTLTVNGTTFGGSLGYGYIYNLTPQVVAVEATVLFDSTGPVSGVTHAPGSDAINITNAGTYAVTFSVSGTEANQFAIFINGAPNVTTVYGSGAGTQQNTGQAILVLSAGDVITLVNHSSAAAVTLASVVGGTQANVSASVLIQRLA